MSVSEYRVQFTVEARATYDALPGERRAQLDKAVRIPARDPFRRNSTAQPGADEHLRRAYLIDENDAVRSGRPRGGSR
jgi:hypothetical protein